LKQQSPALTQKASHQHAPPFPPHSQLEQALGLGAQSLLHEHSSSPASQMKLPQTAPPPH
jgi:hypothetical protein